MINNYPENLIVKDAWGALPLLYSIWGDAPNEIVNFLVNSYQSLYPDHEFDWSEMVITLGQKSISVAVITNLIRVQQSYLQTTILIGTVFLVCWLILIVIECLPIHSAFSPDAAYQHVSSDWYKAFSKNATSKDKHGVMRRTQNLSIMNLSIGN
jgi:hypothetical protein